MSKKLTIVAACLAAVAVAGCGGDEDPGSAVEQTIEIQAFDFYFDPTALTAQRGAEVTLEFANVGEVAHSFTATDLDVEIESGGGEDASVTFTAPAEPGSYDFFCKYHPDDMQGTISIGGSDEPVEEQPGEDDDVDVDVDVEET
jgi:plastocyanin